MNGFLSLTRQRKGNNRTRERERKRWKRKLGRITEQDDINAIDSLILTHSTSILVGGKVYLIGGSLNDEFDGANHEVYTFDIFNEAWSKVMTNFEGKNQPPSLRSHTATLVKDSIILLGGLIQTTVLTTRSSLYKINTSCFELDLPTNRWKTLWTYGEEKFRRYVSHIAEYIERKHEIIVFGGYSYKLLNQLLRLDVTSMKWDNIIDKGIRPCARSHHMSCARGNKLFVYGGFYHEAVPVNLHILTISQTYTWSTPELQGLIPPQVSGASLSLYRNKVFLFGGLSSDLNSTSSLFVFSFDDSTFTQADISFWRLERTSQHTAVCTRESILVLGGAERPFREYMSINPAMF